VPQEPPDSELESNPLATQLMQLSGILVNYARAVTYGGSTLTDNKRAFITEVLALARKRHLIR
jgi:hypothetical protein